MKYLMVFLLKITLTIQVHSQNNNANQLPKLVPPSPTAMAMQRYGDVPVGAYTGIPSISIPIYEVNSDDIKLPISLSYHAGGIRVSDEASRVGLGWILNAGGSITRNIVGTDDFVASNLLNYHNSNTSVPDLVNGMPWGQTGSFYVQDGCNFVMSGYNGSVNNFIKDGFDFQPDQYQYSAGGYSGKFILKRNKEVILSKKEKVKIVVLDNDANVWEITTPEGFVYRYQEFETYTDNEASTAGAPGTYKTSWYLTKITSPKGAIVNLSYITASSVYTKPIGSITETQNSTVYSYTPLSTCNLVSSTSLYPTSTRTTPGKEYKLLYLDKISFQDGEIRFVYASDRQDIINDVRLTKVQLFRNTYNPSSTQLFKEWELTHNYFIGSGDDDFNTGTTDQRSKRLKLVSVREKDNLGNGLTPYTFTYNNEDVLNANNYPAKTSYARDHWGYYNGKNLNTSLVPNYTPMNSSNIVDFNLGIMGDNRDPDPNYSQLFILKEIKYPTGGKSVFEYEQNDFDYENSKLFDQSYQAAFPEPRSGPTIYRLYNGSISGDQPTAADLPNKLADLTALYTAPGVTSSMVHIEAFFRFTSPITSCNLSAFIGKITFSLNREDGSIVEGPSDLSFLTAPTGVCQGNQGILYSKDISLSPGKYYMKIRIEPGVTIIADVAVTFSQYTINANLSNITNGGQTIAKAGFGGGLRIKRVLTYDNGVQTAPMVKRYVYSFIGDDGKYHSSGIRMAKPVYTYVQKEVNKEECILTGGREVFPSIHQHFMRESDSHTPLNGSAGGGVVGYSRVAELIGENGEFGKTEYYYENKPDRVPNYSMIDIIANTIAVLPIRPPINSTVANPGNGNLLRKIDFRFKNNSFEKVAETINTYFDFIGTSPTWYGIEKRVVSGSNAATNPCAYLTFTYPAVIENRSLLTASTSILYDMNDPNKSTISTTKFLYDHNSHLQLKEKAETLNAGISKVTRLTYPADYTDTQAGTVVSDMKNNRFMHASVITANTFLNTATTSQLLSGIINRYQIMNSKVLNMETALTELSQPVAAAGVASYLPGSGSAYPSNYVPKLLFESYDAANNVTQMREKDNTPLSYIWDYNASYPIAEVTNAVQTDIAYSSFEADGTGNWSIPSTTRDMTIALTGTKSYNLINGALTKSGLTSGKTYVVSYWSRNGAYAITGGTIQASKQGRSFNGWTFFEVEITSTGSIITVSGSGLIDELRCYPKGALMSTYTYTPLVGISSQADAVSRVVYYEYDNFGRLQTIKDQDGNILKTFEYKYKQ